MLLHVEIYGRYRFFSNSSTLRYIRKVSISPWPEGRRSSELKNTGAVVVLVMHDMSIPNDINYIFVHENSDTVRTRAAAIKGALLVECSEDRMMHERTSNHQWRQPVLPIRTREGPGIMLYCIAEFNRRKWESLYVHGAGSHF